MFPLRDENPTEMTPLITIALIAANVAVWIYVQGAGMSHSQLASSVCTYGLIPAEITGQMGDYRGIELGRGAVCTFGGLTWWTSLTSMFLHGGWLHLIGNMWFLWLFGNNIEDSMGHLRFLLFYVLVGLSGSAGHVLATAGTEGAFLPTVGASGAISGVMGAYLLLYPRVRIHTLFFFFIFVRIIPIPAWFVLAEWLIVQLLYGSLAGGIGGGVAFWAHVGGFAAGFLLVKIFENRTLVRARREHVKLSPSELPHGGWW